MLLSLMTCMHNMMMTNHFDIVLAQETHITSVNANIFQELRPDITIETNCLSCHMAGVTIFIYLFSRPL